MLALWVSRYIQYMKNFFKKIFCTGNEFSFSRILPLLGVVGFFQISSIATTAKAADGIECAPSFALLGSGDSASSLAQAKVQDFLAKRWDHMPERHAEITKFLEDKFFSNPDFLKYPKAFVKDYKRSAGGFDVLLVPEDPALEFMRDLYKTGELEDFVKSVKAANPGRTINIAPDVVEALSRASAENPAVLRLSVIGVEGADKMEQALRAIGAKVEGMGYPLESMPPQGARIVTITNQEQAEKLKEVFRNHEDAIGGARVEPKPVQVAANVARPAAKAAKPVAEPSVASQARIQGFLAKRWDHMPERHAEITKFLEDKFFSNPEFLKDPKAFVASYKREGGNFDVLILPEDPALGFMRELYKTGELEDFVKGLKAANPAVVVKPAARSAASAVSSSPQAKVQDFLAKRWGHMPERHAEITKFLEDKFFSNPDFLKYPRAFVNDYKRSAGNFDVLLVPEDPALEFMRDLYKTGELEDFAKSVKAANPGRTINIAPDVVEALSRASAENPAVLRLSVVGVEGADKMEQALRATGAKVEGMGYPLESMPPQGTRIVTVTNQEQATKLKAVLQNYEDAIGGARVEPKPAQVASTAARPAASAPVAPKAKVETYLAKQWDHMPERHEAIKNFLEEKFFSNPEFLKDPKAFVKNYKREGGNFDVLILPEDPALGFMRELYKTGELEDFVKSLKAAK